MFRFRPWRICHRHSDRNPRGRKRPRPRIITTTRNTVTKNTALWRGSLWTRNRTRPVCLIMVRCHTPPTVGGTSTVVPSTHGRSTRPSYPRAKSPGRGERTWGIHICVLRLVLIQTGQLWDLINRLYRRRISQIYRRHRNTPELAGCTKIRKGLD